MSKPMEAMAEQPFTRTGKTTTTRKTTYRWLILVWVVLVGGGAFGAKVYTEHLKSDIEADLAKQSETQLQQVQADYQKQLSDLKGQMSGDMAKLQAKVDSLNELLAFAKDSANSKTDNSNQLYTQLQDVEKKLDELQKNLDTLK